MITGIINEIREIDTAPKKIRNFGITFFVVFFLIGGLLVYKGHILGYVGFGLGLLFLAFGIWSPGKLKDFYKIWMGLALVLGFFMSRFILCILYYFVLTPIGVIMRLFGKDLLDQRWDKEAQSYWIKRERKPFEKRQYEKLY